jgi:putative membrane protein
MVNAFVAAIHFIGAFGVVATVFCEWLIFSRSPTFAEARRIQRCDAWYGIFAIVVVIAGLLRVYYFEKGSAFYLHNWIFITKIALFAVVGLLSIYPTVQFIGWRKATREKSAPTMTDEQHASIAIILRIELALLACMIVAASLMAKAIGSWFN